MHSDLLTVDELDQRPKIGRECVFQFLALILLPLLSWHWIARRTADLLLYWDAAKHVALGELPSVSFPLPYPPMSAVVFALPRLLGANLLNSTKFYELTFAIVAALAAAGCTPSIAALASRFDITPRVAIRRYTILLIALFVLVVARYDIFPALCTVLALHCLLEDRPKTSGAWLGLGIALKLYPIVLAPIFLLHPALRGRWKDAGGILLGIGIAIVLPLIPYLAIHSRAFLDFVNFHRQRGLQLESLPGAWVMLAAKLKWTTSAIANNFGADHVASPMATVLRQWQPIVAFTSLAAVTVRAAIRMRRDIHQTGDIRPRTILDESLIVLLVFIVTNKVLSPQYLVWLAPLLPLTSRNIYRGGAALSFATLLLFTMAYRSFVRGSAVAIVLINLRNVSLLALLFAIVFRKEIKPVEGVGVVRSRRTFSLRRAA